MVQQCFFQRSSGRRKRRSQLSSGCPSQTAVRYSDGGCGTCRTLWQKLSRTRPAPVADSACPSQPAETAPDSELSDRVPPARATGRNSNPSRISDIDYCRSESGIPDSAGIAEDRFPREASTGLHQPCSPSRSFRPRPPFRRWLSLVWGNSRSVQMPGDLNQRPRLHRLGAFRGQVTG